MKHSVLYWAVYSLKSKKDPKLKSDWLMTRTLKTQLYIVACRLESTITVWHFAHAYLHVNTWMEQNRTKQNKAGLNDSRRLVSLSFIKAWVISLPKLLNMTTFLFQEHYKRSPCKYLKVIFYTHEGHAIYHFYLKTDSPFLFCVFLFFPVSPVSPFIIIISILKPRHDFAWKAEVTLIQSCWKGIAGEETGKDRKKRGHKYTNHNIISLSWWSCHWFKLRHYRNCQIDLWMELDFYRFLSFNVTAIVFCIHRRRPETVTWRQVAKYYRWLFLDCLDSSFPYRSTVPGKIVLGAHRPIIQPGTGISCWDVFRRWLDSRRR